ncbi:MAG: DUF4160 domain-containing protein [Oscillospiraceae bacterium]|nr:DUF4160 domain-containing protein [Oscillospiraceae bacterium]
MPELSRFYGIIITMNSYDHNPPHFHVEYNGRKALFSIKDGTFIKGSIPTKEARLVLAWYELHKEELLANWEKLMSGEGYDKINPL